MQFCPWFLSVSPDLCLEATLAVMCTAKRQCSHQCIIRMAKPTLWIFFIWLSWGDRVPVLSAFTLMKAEWWTKRLTWSHVLWRARGLIRGPHTCSHHKHPHRTGLCQVFVSVSHSADKLLVVGDVFIIMDVAGILQIWY